jgi:hypothetical protein
LWYWDQEATQCLKGSFTRFFASGFFHESVSPQPLIPVANLPPVSSTLAKMVEKFAAGVFDTWEYLREFSKKFGN